MLVLFSLFLLLSFSLGCSLSLLSFSFFFYFLVSIWYVCMHACFFFFTYKIHRWSTPSQNCKQMNNLCFMILHLISELHSVLINWSSASLPVRNTSYFWCFTLYELHWIETRCFPMTSTSMCIRKTSAEQTSAEQWQPEERRRRGVWKQERNHWNVLPKGMGSPKCTLEALRRGCFAFTSLWSLPQDAGKAWHDFSSDLKKAPSSFTCICIPLSNINPCALRECFWQGQPKGNWGTVKHLTSSLLTGITENYFFLY